MFYGAGSSATVEEDDEDHFWCGTFTVRQADGIGPRKVAKCSVDIRVKQNCGNPLHSEKFVCVGTKTSLPWETTECQHVKKKNSATACSIQTHGRLT